MIRSLQAAIESLLQNHLPEVFSGSSPATLNFPESSWLFDPLITDPIASEPGAKDAHDLLPFNASEARGPYTLTQTPYPGPKRIYLHSDTTGKIALSDKEIIWDNGNNRVFSLSLRADRALQEFNGLEILYTVVGITSQISMQHKALLQLSAADAATTERAYALALSVLILNRRDLMAQSSESWKTSHYQVQSIIKELKLNAGSAPNATTRELELEIHFELQLQCLLSEDEGTAIQQIISPGQTASSRSISIEPEVEA